MQTKTHQNVDLNTFGCSKTSQCANIWHRHLFPSNKWVHIYFILQANGKRNKIIRKWFMLVLSSLVPGEVLLPYWHQTHPDIRQQLNALTLLTSKTHTDIRQWLNALTLLTSHSSKHQTVTQCSYPIDITLIQTSDSDTVLLPYWRHTHPDIRQWLNTLTLLTSNLSRHLTVTQCSHPIDIKLIQASDSDSIFLPYWHQTHQGIQQWLNALTLLTSNSSRHSIVTQW